MNFVMFGPPGAGKGTQSKYLQEKYGFIQLSTGDLVRQEIAAGTETGKLIKKTVDEGLYASDDIIISLVERAYDPTRKGYIFDGFPRTVNQAQILEKMLAKFDQKIDAVFDIKLSDQVIHKRILGRYTCKNCGEIYNRYFKNPHEDGECDVCGEKEFSTRTDDTAEAVQNRIDTYHKVTQPVLAYFKERTEVISIDGEQAVEEVQKQLESAVGRLISKKQQAKCVSS